uniref:TMC domain-containing protein n=1 Tax=Acrobeloides nanus TaxID=290746 RepID=A0A914CHZ3_9BILA
MGVPTQLPPRHPSARSRRMMSPQPRHFRGSIPSPRGASSPTFLTEMVERERARRAASHVQTSGIAASVESGIYPYSRRASSIYGAHRRSLAIIGANASQEGSIENIRERTRSNLTLDEELYDILFAFGEADMYGVSHKDEDEDAEAANKPMTRQLLLDKIRQKKEVINKLRCQAWNMNRKRRTLRLAQKYLEQHESKVSKTHLYKEELLKRWSMFLRWATNINTYLIPWESRIKKIESHFGSVVSSYFTFLRWVVYMNLIITLLVVSFVVIPEVLADVTNNDRRNLTRAEKIIPDTEVPAADTWAVIWGYNGYLRYSPIFYGYYSNDEYVSTGVKYSLPLAYFMIVLVVFGYSFFAILRKMASNASMSKMAGSKAEQYIFNWKVFTGWDYTIGNPETATNTHMAIVIKLRESIAESRVQEREKFQCLKFSLRVLANSLIISMIAFSIYVISFAVKGSDTGVEPDDTLGGSTLSKNRVPTVVSTITHVFPMVFDLIGRMENYHPRTALRAHLARVLVLYVLNYVTLIYTLFDKIENIRGNHPRKDSHEGPSRSRRQLGGRNPNMDRPPPFASRNFSNRTQMQKFMQGTKKIPYNYPITRKPDIIAKPDGKAITVQSQYGPVGVNHPTALVRNVSWANDTHRFMNNTKRYSTTRLGPTPLPIITPPPRPPTPKTKTFRTQKYGPDWRATASTPDNEDQDSKNKGKNAGIGVISAHSGKGSSGDYGDGIEVTIDPLNATYLDELLGNDTLYNETELLTSKESLRDHPGAGINEAVCWETLIGQEIVKLVTMDLIITIFSIIVIDFLRGLWVKYCSSWWCWDIETTFPEYGEFKVAENVLHIINNQVGYVIASKRPSLHCGPFARQDQFYDVISNLIKKYVDEDQLTWLKYIASPGVIIPLVLLLLLIIYFLVSLVKGLREANTDLQQQLVHERTEEKKKIFELAGGGTKKKSVQEPDRVAKHKEAKKMGQYLPEVESKRREPWRMYNNSDQNASLCPTDRTESSIASPTSAGSRSPNTVRSKIQKEFLPIVQPPSPTKPNFQPSLTSLDEVENSDNPSTSGAETGPYPLMKSSLSGGTTITKDVTMPSLAMSKSKSGLTDRVDDWFNDENQSEKSFDALDRSVDVATPDEIRTHVPKSYSTHTPNDSNAVYTYGVPRESTALPVYAKEPKRIGAAQEEEPAKKTKSPPKENDKNSKKFETPSLTDEFKPWPSIEEVRMRRASLTKPPPVPKHRSRSPPKMVKSEHAEQTTSSSAPRFRISVSPTRKLPGESSGSDTDTTASKKRRFVIRQRLLPGSTASLASTATPQSQPSTNSQPPKRPDMFLKPGSPKAPMVEFGEDDSPRIQEMPPMPKKK